MIRYPSGRTGARRDVPANATNLAANRRCQRLTACY